MREQMCFFVGILFGFIAWGVFTVSAMWPELRRQSRNEALRPLLMFHSFRFIGSAFMVPGVVSPICRNESEAAVTAARRPA